jgi:hypothetical protein
MPKKLRKIILNLFLASSFITVSQGMERDLIPVSPQIIPHTNRQSWNKEQGREAFKNLEKFHEDVFSLYKKESSKLNTMTLLRNNLCMKDIKEESFKPNSQALEFFLNQSPETQKDDLEKRKEPRMNLFLNLVYQIESYFIYEKLTFDDRVVCGNSIDYFHKESVGNRTAREYHPDLNKASLKYYREKLLPYNQSYTYIANTFFNLIKEIGVDPIDRRGGVLSIDGSLLAYIPQQNPFDYPNTPYLFSPIKNPHGSNDRFKFRYYGNSLVPSNDPTDLIFILDEQNNPIFEPFIHTRKNTDFHIECTLVEGADSEIPYRRLSGFFNLDHFEGNLGYDTIKSYYDSKKTRLFQEKAFPLVFPRQEISTEEDIGEALFEIVDNYLRDFPKNEQEQFLLAILGEEETSPEITDKPKEYTYHPNNAGHSC